MAETKPKPGASSLRTPGPKKKLGLSVPPALRMPHEDLITPAQPQANPDSEQSAILPSMPSQTTQTSTTTQTSHTHEKAPIAPERDFTKVANSIGRQAVPAGLFAGKSKQLYDCL